MTTKPVKSRGAARCNTTEDHLDNIDASSSGLPVAMVSQGLTTAAPVADFPNHTTEELATALLHPAATVCRTLTTFNSGFPNFDRTGLATELLSQIRAVNTGDLSRAEAMLVTQAHGLDAMFNTLAQLAYKEDRIDNAEVLMRLGLKAQSQCRATIEALARMKNPSSFASIQQANVAYGPQQVNNATIAKPPRRRRQNKSPQIKLSGKPIELLPYDGTPAPKSRVNPQLGTVEEIDWTEDPPG